MKLTFGILLVVVVLFATSCASSRLGGGTASKGESFDLEGWRLIGCCCGSPCPCRINKKPMRCHGCDHTDVIHIDKGYLGTTDVSGITWVIAGRGFGEDVNQNWVYVYVTDKATDAQYKALGDMLNDDVKSWGDKAAFLAGKFVGMRKVPMTTALSPDGLGYSCKIPGILDIETCAIVNPGRTEPVKSSGIMDAWGDSFTQCNAKVHTLNDASIGYSWDLSGLQANFANFHLTPEKKAAGGGWGCWTANAKYGDNSPYQEQLHDHK
ncbi:MAG: DUF1326 domain-containing protein [Planctomycetes bacterium]|nr:DUF1326 domain-containing protein [Planctomycetota bacterium]MBI3844160.1 DUF1326 domain-containing protein [Planctomycetota bacterium]